MPENVLAAVKSADRVLDLLELLADGGRDMSHIDISEALQIPKSSLTQLLKNLVGRDYVEFVPESRSYRLGQAVITLSRGVGEKRELATIIQPFLAELTRATGESSALNQLRGEMAEVVATVLGPARLVTHMRLGDLAPLYATSGGKAILAHMPTDFQEAYIARVRFEAATAATLRTAKALRVQLTAIRRSGLAYSREEWTPGIVGIGFAVLDGEGAPRGAVNVAIPAARLDVTSQRRMEGLLRDASSDLHRRLLPRRRTGSAEAG